MRKAWGGVVRTLCMNWVHAGGLPTVFGVVKCDTVNNPGFFAQVPSKFYPHLYTTKNLFFNLLGGYFSPLSTLPITTTTIKYIYCINRAGQKHYLEAAS